MVDWTDFTQPDVIGWTFIVIGVLFLLLEATMPGFFLGVPATILLIMGVLAFVAPSIALHPTYAPLIVILIGIPATLVTIYAYRRMAPPDAAPTTMSSDRLVGAAGEVLRAVEPGTGRGKVRIERMVWSATAEAPIPVGARVRVVKVEGVILKVQPEPGETGKGA